MPRWRTTTRSSSTSSVTCSTRRSSSRCCSPSAERATSRRLRAASTTSSCAATRMSSSDADIPGSPEAVKHRWEELKTEQEGREGVFHDLPEPLPALLYARKVQRRAASTGFASPDVDARLAGLHEQLDELRAELRANGDAASGDGAGREAPRVARRRAVRRRRRRVRAERRLRARPARREPPVHGARGGAARERHRPRRGAADPRLARQPDGRGRRPARVGGVRSRRRSLRRLHGRA